MGFLVVFLILVIATLIPCTVEAGGGIGNSTGWQFYGACWVLAWLAYCVVGIVYLCNHLAWVN